MDEIVVSTSLGRMRGRARSDGTFAFRGIPYAAPPVGTRRFRPPERVEAWTGELDATRYGPQIAQVVGRVEEFFGGAAPPASDEGALLCNVVTPGLDDARRPVMVWIHGGAFVSGNGGTPAYDGRWLCTAGDVVVVSINYRLGALGWMYLGGLDPSFADCGNLGLRDQVAALEWVRANIAAFGGDPDNVTIFGESAGGMSVHALLACPAAQGLFHRAVSQSGALGRLPDVDQATARAVDLLDALGLTPADAARLRDLPLAALLDAQAARPRPEVFLPYGPVLDGTVLPHQPLDAVAAGSGSVPLLVGTNQDEFSLYRLVDPTFGALGDAPNPSRRYAAAFAASSTPDPLAVYADEAPGSSTLDLLVAAETDRCFRIPAIRLAEAHARAGGPTWAYLLTWASDAFDGTLGACHGLDVTFVFGSVGKVPAVFTGNRPGQEELAARMQGAWLALARDGDPNHALLPTWPDYNPSRATLRFDDVCDVVDDPDARRRELWEGIALETVPAR